MTILSLKHTISSTDQPTITHIYKFNTILIEQSTEAVSVSQPFSFFNGSWYKAMFQDIFLRIMLLKSDGDMSPASPV